jgi:thioredoxin-dependent peroxiredoxin
MKHLKIGDKAPVFSGIDQNNQTISLDTYTGKKVVLYFYPKDDTPGCTAQACNLRDNHDSLIKAGIQVIGVSADSLKSHLKFSDKYELPFPLISDEDKKIIQDYGVWGEKKFMGKIYDGIHRTTFIIDESRTIVGILDKPNTKNHTEEIFTFLKIN